MKYVNDLSTDEIEKICMVILDKSLQDCLMTQSNPNIQVEYNLQWFDTWMLAYVWDSKLQKDLNCKIELMSSMKRYKMIANCGCCEIEDIYFKSDKSANSKINSIGLTSSGEFVDDLGNTHTGVDTFYGIFLYEEDVKSKNKFDILLNKLEGSVA